MSGIVQKICDNISLFTASQLAELKSVGVIQRPVYTVSRVAALARVIKNTLDCFWAAVKKNWSIILMNGAIWSGELKLRLATFLRFSMTI